MKDIETMPDRKPVYNFAAVRDAAARHMITARLYLFDGGETIELARLADGKQLLRYTAMWGDDPTVNDYAAKWLMENTTVTVFDFVGN